eukprot:14745180-Ditylum_brightwellii.AAC.1
METIPAPPALTRYLALKRNDVEEGEFKETEPAPSVEWLDTSSWLQDRLQWEQLVARFGKKLSVKQHRRKRQMFWRNILITKNHNWHH